MASIVSGGATHGADSIALAWDREAGTRYTSGVNMEPGMAVWFELDKPAMIGGISATTPEPHDNPADWTAFVMDSDGGHGLKEVAKGHGPIIATWLPVAGQWVKIVCDSTSNQYWLSITDLTIDAADIPPVVEPPPVVPPVVPPPDPDVLVGPLALEEPAARYLVEQLALKWGWPIRQRDGVDFTTGEVTVEQSVSFVVAKARAQGILEPFPFS